MGQFVGQETPAGRRIRRVTGGVEDDILPHGISNGMDLLRGLRGAPIRMNPDGAEIAPESRFEIHPRFGVERLTRRTKHG
jgi:hypothetical protein